MGSSPQVEDAIKTFAFGGFLTASTLIIGFNFKVFNNIFKENARQYWWLFLISAFIPIALVLSIFSYFFS
ncbi:hypothetical protein A3E15_01170 [Candidatus Woesebacteria bacterium RIFCSPHIGHO2_12_FULL_42_9]|uniref:Uncharacterized protein n=3 Tax=Candidatus Woeseibacteriota TaxID=1752722 RepID=A0A1F8ATA3_9BACT|nr:MAG: hypothetical protein A2112_01295 [Candidatus Woesebacteria bacterium GWA1_42_12]OGM06697.1 MAG: hypothetical protein A2129_01400 [Candidatus Woesebacteria bacterium GWC1_42_13]OGM54528.1 MAG: hypothetical protein A3E15_01170 [Candidatus Woesebacteria bacterium RIFCSPHIGHO2_12_FULL_42_9]